MLLLVGHALAHSDPAPHVHPEGGLVLAAWLVLGAVFLLATVGAKRLA